jgi:hypothetical protein
MAYTPVQLAEIREAEREYYELCFRQLLTSVAIYVSAGVMLEEETSRRGDWIETHAKLALERWRNSFCPSRAGLPLETEWPES